MGPHNLRIRHIYFQSRKAWPYKKVICPNFRATNRQPGRNSFAFQGINPRGNYGQEPAARNTGGQINLTIDGMKMFGACTDKMDPVSIYIEPQNLKSIQATLGSEGSKLGTTVGGSVDMQLAQATLSSKPVSMGWVRLSIGMERIQ
ncbi:MAG: hypothetical protein IPJ20_14960 [Flammeovirgaceae bacterium]|nr:hypothetical protein [Flammeovirgaceae bacterium]